MPSFARSRRALRATAVATCLAGAALSSTALAAEPTDGAALPARDQSETDITVIPDGMGAIFVPGLEARTPESVTVVVMFEGRILATGRPGRRIVVPPGHYRVLVGEGRLDHRPAVELDVADGVTTRPVATYGVLRVSVVDPSGRPVEEDFSVGAVDAQRTFGPFRPEGRAGERPSIGLYLPAGRYTLALGSNPRAEEGSSAVVVAAGEVAQMRMVVDDRRLLRTEFGESEPLKSPSSWKVTWVIAADGSLASKSNQVGGWNGQALTLGLYSKFSLAFDSGRHLAKLDVSADESAVGITASPSGSAEFPLQKLTDDLRAEVLYNYRVGGAIGPYVRAVGYTSLLPTKYYAGRGLDATTFGPDGQITRTERFEAGQNYRLFPELAPFIAQEGAGVGTAYEGDALRFALRGGAAARQGMFFDGRYVQSVNGDTIQLTQLGDVHTFGAEATAMLGFRIRGMLDLDSRLDAFLGEDQFATVFKGEGTYRPVYRWDNSATLRLGKYVSLIYTLGLRRDAQAVENDQIAQSLRLRLAWSVF